MGWPCWERNHPIKMAIAEQDGGKKPFQPEVILWPFMAERMPEAPPKLPDDRFGETLELIKDVYNWATDYCRKAKP